MSAFVAALACAVATASGARGRYGAAAYWAPRGSDGDIWPTPSCHGSRPPPRWRRFNSTAVEALIESYRPRFRDENISRIFENAFPNCLDTTIYHTQGANDTFVITGDIEAMWLRDSTNQLLPYLALAPQDPHLKDMLCGAVRRQARQVAVSRYANAFNLAATGAGHKDDIVATQPPVSWCSEGEVFESKYELNSLVNALRLSTAYHDATQDLSCFRGSANWLPAMAAIVGTIRAQQGGTLEEFPNAAYTFSRQTTSATDTLMNGGRGVPAKRCGMSKSYFRASDDAVALPFNVADNAFAVVALRAVAPLVAAVGNASLSAQATTLAAEIDDGIKSHGVVAPGGDASQSHYAYEADGFGSTYFMDDANVPSLLSLPYLGYVACDDPAYLRTRAMVLSNATNPWFFSGPAGEGVGGPHVGTGYVWPMSITMRALTSTDDAEIAECLATLARSTAGTFFMHESFSVADATRYTRPWFSWANSLFAELIIQLAKERPHLIFKDAQKPRK